MTEESKKDWQAACAQCGYTIVRKGTPQYDKVFNAFIQMRQQRQGDAVDLDESLKLWRKAVASITGDEHRIVRKDDPIYVAVRKRYDQLIDSTPVFKSAFDDDDEELPEVNVRRDRKPSSPVPIPSRTRRGAVK